MKGVGLAVEQAIAQLLLWTQERVNKVSTLQSSVSSLKREQAALGQQMETLSAKVGSFVGLST